MAERDALIKTDHPFIIKLYYSFQVGDVRYCSFAGFAGAVFRDVVVSRWQFLGSDQVRLLCAIDGRALRLPGRGCDPALVRFYLAEVPFFPPIDRRSSRQSTISTIPPT